jgi:hypothetical protein
MTVNVMTQMFLNVGHAEFDTKASLGKGGGRFTLC